MAKKYTLEGEIGWGIETYNVKNILRAAGGEDIVIDFSSPGGSVFTGMSIFNLFKAYSGRVTFNIIGLAASMGSYIPLAADEITAEANAVWMIHNARSFISGDQNAMRKRADIIEGLSTIMAKQYVERTGTPQEEIQAMMDEETYLFGQEIVDAGFVDSINGTEDSDPDARAMHVAVARESFEAIMSKVHTEKANDYEEAAALLPQFESNAGSLLTDTKPVEASRDNHKTEVTKAMDVNELKAKHADVAAALIAEGVEKGVASERDRINAHLIMGEASGDMVTALKAVEDGSEMTATLHAKYTAASMNKNALGAHAADSDAAGDAADGVATDADVETEADVVATELEKTFGIVTD